MDEDFNELMMDCTNCHLKFVATELKLDQTGDSLVCSNCFVMPGSKLEILNQPKKRAVSKVFESRFPERPEPRLTPKPSQPLAPQPTRTLRLGDAAHLSVPVGHKGYKCEHCRYEFSRKLSWKGNCPYCSKVGTLKTLKVA